MSKREDKPMYINQVVIRFIVGLFNFFNISKKDMPFRGRDAGHYISPANWYNHRSGTFKKNKRRGF